MSRRYPTWAEWPGYMIDAYIMMGSPDGHYRPELPCNIIGPVLPLHERPGYYDTMPAHLRLRRDLLDAMSDYEAARVRKAEHGQFPSIRFDKREGDWVAL